MMSLIRVFNVIIILIVIFIGCNSQSKNGYLSINTEEKNTIFFRKNEFVVETWRTLGNSHSFSIAQNKKTKKHYVFYLDELQLDSNQNHLILSRILVPTRDSNQYIQSGSFTDMNGDNQLVVAIEKYNLKELPDPSIEIYDLWILNRNKFIKKNEKKYFRIHETYYLKKDTASWSSYDDYEKLKKKFGFR